MDLYICVLTWACVPEEDRVCSNKTVFNHWMSVLDWIQVLHKSSTFYSVKCISRSLVINIILKLYVFLFICVCLSISRKPKESRKGNRSLRVRGSWKLIVIGARIQTPILQESSHSKLQSHLSSMLKMLNDLCYTFLKVSIDFSNN